MQNFSSMVSELIFLATPLVIDGTLVGVVLIGVIIVIIGAPIARTINKIKENKSNSMENHVKDMQEVKWNVSNVLTMIDLGKLQFDENEYEQLLNDDMYLSNRNNVIISIMAGLSSVPTVIVKHQDNYFVPDINIKGAQSRIAIIKEFYKNSFALPQSESPASNYGCDRLYYKDFSQDQEKVFLNSKLSFKIFTNKDS